MTRRDDLFVSGLKLQNQYWADTQDQSAGASMDRPSKKYIKPGSRRWAAGGPNQQALTQTRTRMPPVLGTVHPAAPHEAVTGGSSPRQSAAALPEASAGTGAPMAAGDRTGRRWQLYQGSSRCSSKRHRRTPSTPVLLDSSKASWLARREIQDRLHAARTCPTASSTIASQIRASSTHQGCTTDSCRCTRTVLGPSTRRSPSVSASFEGACGIAARTRSLAASAG